MGCGIVPPYSDDGALSSSVVVSSPVSEPSLLPSSLGRLALRISNDFCFHSVTSWCECMGSTGTGTVTRRLVGSSGPAVARGKVLLNVTMVSLPMGLRGARSSTSTLARFKLPKDAFSRWMGRFRASKEDGAVISSLLSDA